MRTNVMKSVSGIICAFANRKRKIIYILIIYFIVQNQPCVKPANSPNSKTKKRRVSLWGLEFNGEIGVKNAVDHLQEAAGEERAGSPASV